MHSIIKKSIFTCGLLAFFLLTSCKGQKTADPAGQQASFQSDVSAPSEKYRTLVKAALHSLPSTIEGEILAVIPSDTLLTAAAANGDFIKVSWNSKEGYLHSSLLESTSLSVTQTADGGIHSLSDEQLAAIQNTYSTANTGYGAAGTNRDENGRNINAVDTEAKLSEFSPVFFGSSENQSIYLTFSLGWENAPNTSDLLDSLARANVKAVFYVTHEYASSNPELVQRMIDEGHEVGNHGYTHPSDGIPSLSLKEQMEDALLMQNYIYETFGYTMKKYNFSSSAWSVASVALFSEMGYEVCFYSWNYFDYDVSQPTAKEDVLSMLLDGLTPGCIFYLHPVSVGNVQAIPDFISEARKLGYTFMPLP